MAENKKSVLLYCDLIHTIEKMDNETAGQFFKHYLRYVNDLDPKTDNLVVELTFESVKQSLKRDLKKWGAIREKRVKAGKKSAEMRALKKQQISTNPTRVESVQQTSTNPTVSVSDSVSVSVSVSDIRNNNVLTEFSNSLKPFLKTYSKEMLNDFYLYWTEKGIKQRKFRFEKEKSFDVGRRLSRWNKNNFNNRNNLKSENNEQLKEITQSIREQHPNL